MGKKREAKLEEAVMVTTKSHAIIARKEENLESNGWPIPGTTSP